MRMNTTIRNAAPAVLALALAALPGFTLTGDLSASDRYFERDLTEPFVLDAGYLPVPSGPGLGVTPIPELLAEVTSGKVWLGS